MLRVVDVVRSQAESRGSSTKGWAFMDGAAGRRGSVLARSVPRFHLGSVPATPVSGWGEYAVCMADACRSWRHGRIRCGQRWR